jgi:uncharacterized protein YbgA (DUF1722 family)/uncharacterized protein YbbK (DUF523 family)
VNGVDKISVGVSACLLGEKVRYDGGHKHDRFITDTLGEFFSYISVCPEVECGLPVPREAMHLAGDIDDPRLVTVHTGVDHTARMQGWSREKLGELERSGLSGFIFKSKSPSSGMRGVKVYRGSAQPVYSGTGLFAAAFMKQLPLIPVEDEGRLHDPGLRENFIERIFVYHRWQELVRNGCTAAGLIEFHTRHKYLIMAHSPKHLATLGKMVADIRDKDAEKIELYCSTLLEGLRLIATIAKNTNVLHHIMGYFKRDLDRVEKEELLEIIDRYHHGLIPLIVPVTLLNHYTLKYDQPYLKKQYYLNPHPVELMLRNHV